MKSFVVYRFQYLTEFNQHPIDEKDKKVAKMNFHLFDRLLSMDNICVPISSSVTTKKQISDLQNMIRNFNKIVKLLTSKQFQRKTMIVLQMLLMILSKSKDYRCNFLDELTISFLRLSRLKIQMMNLNLKLKLRKMMK